MVILHMRIACKWMKIICCSGAWRRQILSSKCKWKAMVTWDLVCHAMELSMVLISSSRGWMKDISFSMWVERLIFCVLPCILRAIKGFFVWKASLNHHLVFGKQGKFNFNVRAFYYPGRTSSISIFTNHQQSALISTVCMNWITTVSRADKIIL